MEKSTKPKILKEKTYSQLKKKLDEVFSIFIRMRDKGVCFTCCSKSEWKYTDAGHFINRKHLVTRWDERNVHAQCIGCNRFRNGNKEDYAVRLEQLYGHGILQELHMLKQTGKEFKYNELENLINHYQEKIKQL
jgi:hypothetical protein